MTDFARDRLKSFVERIERLEEEKKSIADDIRDVYAEAKSNGFDVKAMRAIVRLRKQDADERAEHEATMDIYMHALGMLFDTPLGQAATERAARTRAATERDPEPDENQIDIEEAIAEKAPAVTLSAPYDPWADLDIPDYLRRQPAETLRT